MGGEGGGDEIFLCSPNRPYCFWGPRSLQFSGNLESFPRDKASRAWSWILISLYCRG